MKNIDLYTDVLEDDFEDYIDDFEKYSEYRDEDVDIDKIENMENDDELER